MRHLALIATAILAAPHALAQEHDHSTHAPAPQRQPPAEDHSGHAGHDMGGETAPLADGRAGAFGPYSEAREGSGTSWAPEAGGHTGRNMLHIGDWMVHGNLDTVYSSQGGPRGDDMGFLAGMLMASNRFNLDAGKRHTIQLRGMISPDPLMGDHGYPLLLAAGETADGVNTLTDRQHPHDVFMELSASYSYRFTGKDSVFLYAGLPGEPAFGPPAFMHRPAAMASPEAPITHHWLDSTHITFGVLTAGYVHDHFKIEASRFRGREPDEKRWDIETGELDSTAVRLSWNPDRDWALQVSWADVTSPEQLEPDVDYTKYSASALYTTNNLAGTFSFTGAFARKESSEDVTLDAWLAEASFQPGHGPWTIFSRFENIETDELGAHAAHGHHGAVENVMRWSLGASHDFTLTDQLTMSLGASLTQNWTSGSLSPLYDGDPVGAMAFVRLKLG